MKTSALSLVAFAASSLAFPGAKGPPGHPGPACPPNDHPPFPDPEGHEFRPASPYDSRSPCPGLNALANHGYLPHDGKDITYELVNKAAMDAYNFEDGFYKDVVPLVFQFNISTSSQPDKTFNLRDLARHDKIEADGSLTRNDIFFGDDLHFDATVWDPIKKDLNLNQAPPSDRHVTMEVAAQATKNRYAVAKSVNPEFNASAFQQMAEYGTTALYLITTWEDGENGAPKPWVKALLEEDRIAYKEGYSKGKTVKTTSRLNEMTQAIRKIAGM